MSDINELIIDNLDIWSSTIKKKKSVGRGSSKKIELYGVKKLRELILDLAMRGLLVPQNINDKSANETLKSITELKKSLTEEKKIKKQKDRPLGVYEQPLVQLPSGWSWSYIGELAELSPKNNLDDDLKVSFIPMSSISTNYDGSHSQEDRKWGEVKKSYTHFAEGDIALAKITPCFENSKAAVFQNLTNRYGAGTTELHIARIFGDMTNKTFVLLYLKSPQFLKVGKTKMTGSAGQKRIPKDFFAFNPLPLPPVVEQGRIVAKVDELMALCDQLEQQQEDSINAHQILVKTLLDSLVDSASHSQTTEGKTKFEQAWGLIAEHFDTLFTTEDSIEQLKQTILQLAVMGKLVPQDSTNEPENDLLKQINEEKERLTLEEGLKTKASEQVTISDQYLSSPDTWGWIRLGNLARFIDYRGKTPQKIESGVRLITAKNVRFGYIDLEPQEFISEKEYTSWMTRGFPVKGDLLFTPEAPLGNIAIIDIDEKFALAQRAICFQCHVSEISPFLLIFIMSEQFQAQLQENASGMTATGIRASKLKEIPVSLPPLLEQDRIVSKVDELLKVCDHLKSCITVTQSIQIKISDAIAKKALS